MASVSTSADALIYSPLVEQDAVVRILKSPHRMRPTIDSLHTNVLGNARFSLGEHKVLEAV